MEASDTAQFPSVPTQVALEEAPVDSAFGLRTTKSRLTSLGGKSVQGLA
jgi:hypothetical protein